MTILDAAGHAVATIDAVADHASDESMSAVWSVDLAGTPATYTAVVDGTGHGDPAAPGGYSDYGSIGRYTVTLVPGRVAPPTTTPTTTPATDTTGRSGTTG